MSATVKRRCEGANIGRGWRTVLAGALLVTLGCSPDDRGYLPDSAGSAGVGGGSGDFGGAGADAGATSAGGGRDNSCAAGERRCSEAGIPQVCDRSSATFVDAPACQPSELCEDGTCVGPCVPGTTRCNADQIVQECDQLGLWQTAMQCPFACVEGAAGAECGGSCVPGTRTCGADQTPHSCDETGISVPDEPCPSVCIGEGECAGDCRPGETRCSETPGSEETCTAEGVWGPATACTFVCDAAADGCGGECKPGQGKQCAGTKVQSCGDDGLWADTQDCGTVPCTMGVCKACTPQTKQCNAGKPQTCTAQGEWTNDQASACPFICDASTGKCAGECVPDSDVCAGAVSKHCSANGTYGTSTTCPNICDPATGKCGGECKPGAKRCSGNTAQTCSSAGKWGSDQACQFGCSSGSGECNTCTAEPITTTCQNGALCGTKANNCGQSVTCPKVCSDGNYCNGVEICQNNACVDQPDPCTNPDGTNCAVTCNESNDSCTIAGVDKDGDGKKSDKCTQATPTLGDDCDDGHDKTYKGAPEICDGKDNDCDTNGAIDEGLGLSSQTFHVGDEELDREEPRIASNGVGYAVLWENTAFFDLKFTTYTQEGVNNLTEIAVASDNSTTQDIAWGGALGAATGNWAVSWFDGSNIRFREWTHAGLPVGNALVVFNGPAAHGRVARVPGGNYVIAYLDYGSMEGLVRAKTYSGTGTTFGSEVSVRNTITHNPVLLATGDNFVVGGGGTSDGSARRYNGSLTSLGSITTITKPPVMGAGDGGFAAVMSNGAGQQPSFYSYNSDGSIICNNTKIGDGTFIASAVAGNAAGYVVVSSNGDTKVRVQRVKADCTLSAIFEVAPGAGTGGHIAASSTGYGVVWESGDNVYRRFFKNNLCD